MELRLECFPATTRNGTRIPLVKAPIMRIKNLGILSLLFLCLSASAQAADYYYTISGGTITITGYNGPGGAVMIPDTIDGLQVTGIGQKAFSWCTGLTSVTIPSSITSIGGAAFVGNFSLGAITVDANNPAFSSLDGALFNKSQTTLVQYPGGKTGSYTIPNGVTSIGVWAFSACTNLTDITIPASVTSIADWAFSWCTSLTNVTIPNRVTGIGGYAFTSCSSLTSVTIGSSVTRIGDQAFSGCPSLIAITVDTNNPVYSSVDGGLFDKRQTRLLQYPRGKTGSYTIPNGVTSIGVWAFSACTNLTSVTIPNSVTSIGDSAFGACYGLTNVIIGNASVILGSGVFWRCDSLPYARIGSGAMLLQRGLCDGLVTIQPTVEGLPVTHLGERLFFGCTNLTSITIPNSLTSIGYSAFWGCTNLNSVTIPDSVTSIGERAFQGCTGLTNITIGNGVTSMGERAFLSCKGLTSITIPNSVTSIGWGAFMDCPGLTSITIGNGVTSIWREAFYSCTSLTSVYFHGNAPYDGEEVFAYSTKVVVYYLPGTTGWGKPFGGRPTVPWLRPNPVILSGSIGIQTNGFGFTTSWAKNNSVVVEASATLVDPIWSPVSTNTLIGGSSSFSDPEWQTIPARFYRVRSQ